MNVQIFQIINKKYDLLEVQVEKSEDNLQLKESSGYLYYQLHTASSLPFHFFSLTCVHLGKQKLSGSNCAILMESWSGQNINRFACGDLFKWLKYIFKLTPSTSSSEHRSASASVLLSCFSELETFWSNSTTCNTLNVYKHLTQVVSN